MAAGSRSGDGRSLAARTQPPFAASSMTATALAPGRKSNPDAMFQVIGRSRRRPRFDGVVKAGQAVRIFTGAPCRGR